jgi:hypothetical protein
LRYLAHDVAGLGRWEAVTLRGRDSETPPSRPQYTHEAGGRLTILAGIVAALRRRVECDSQPFRLRFHRRGRCRDESIRRLILLFGLLALSLVVLGWLVLLGLRWL